MDVGVDQPRRDETSAGVDLDIVAPPIVGFDGGDDAVAHHHVVVRQQARLRAAGPDRAAADDGDRCGGCGHQAFLETLSAASAIKVSDVVRSTSGVIVIFSKWNSGANTSTFCRLSASGASRIAIAPRRPSTP